MIPFCIDQGIAVIPWSPLARGFLAGNRPRDIEESETVRARTDGFDRHLYFRDADYAVVDAVKALAEQHGVSAAQIALAWMLHQPGVTCPIVGASKMYQLDQAIAALNISLTEEEIAGLEAPYQVKPILGHG
jgi:aryl-alcohol dehydrogenase (NADP+)